MAERASAADVLAVRTRFRRHRVEPSSQGRRNLVQIALAFVATLRSPLCSEVTVEPAKVIVLNKCQWVSRNHIAAAPRSRLLLGPAAVFKPNTIVFPLIACGRSEFEIFKSDEDSSVQSYDL